MALVYEETPRGNFSGSIQCDATKMYVTHFKNYLYLKFIYANSDKTLEKMQASKELAIAEKKMKYWASRHDYDEKRSMEECNNLKKQWRI